MRFYVASGLGNSARARALIERLVAKGHTCTYDWTLHGDVRAEGHERMRDVSERELAGVTGAELFIALLPGGCGTHTELGMALASRGNKRIVLYSETPELFNSSLQTCAFYHNGSAERVVGTVEELLAHIGE